jgi:hypothetical protein
MPQYRVQIVEVRAPWGFTRHMKVQRADGKSGISWDDLQRLKDEHLGPDILAVELYPPAHRVVDELNMRHLWEVPEHVLPIGLKQPVWHDSTPQ